MRTTGYLIAGALMLAVAMPASAKPSPAIAAAVADKGRPAEDTARDAARKPTEMLVFAGVRPGMKIGELLPGGGYFTRVFAKAIGPKGKVYAWYPAGMPARVVDRFAPIPKAYPNVVFAQSETFAAAEPLDMVWTSQNYHDLYLRGGNPASTNEAIFKALKPGGVYVVVDHRGAAGTGTSEAGTLHRIDEAAVISGVLKAGFVLDDEDMSLRRAEDDHTKRVFDLHDATDQMVLKFRKPGK